MSRHLKNIVMSGLKNLIATYVPSPAVSTRPARGVRYFRPITDVDFFWGAMDNLKVGRKRRKHIIVRRMPRLGNRLLQLYTYHFPKTWSAACVANRELIKTAQRIAHALEHDTSRAGLEWKLRFLKHYFTVCVGGAKPEPGLKRYSRFYQYTYVSIYRELQAASQPQEQEINIDDITVEPLDGSSVHPIDHRPLRSRRTCPLNCALSANTNYLRPFSRNFIPTSPSPPPASSILPWRSASVWHFERKEQRGASLRP